MAAAMWDLETLSTKLDSVILTLGGVKFNPYSKEEPYDPIYLRIDVDEQLAAGRRYDEHTMAWWLDQDPEVREEAIGEEGRIPMADAIKQFHAWVLHSDTVWSNGSVFDIMIMENFYDQMGMFHPWEHWRIRDCRTVYNMGVPHGMDQGDLHNALADAYTQAMAVQHVFCELGIVPPWEEKKK
jgi:hypothetical protein